VCEPTESPPFPFPSPPPTKQTPCGLRLFPSLSRRFFAAPLGFPSRHREIFRVVGTNDRHHPPPPEGTGRPLQAAGRRRLFSHQLLTLPAAPPQPSSGPPPPQVDVDSFFGTICTLFLSPFSAARQLTTANPPFPVLPKLYELALKLCDHKACPVTPRRYARASALSSLLPDTAE